MLISANDTGHFVLIDRITVQWRFASSSLAVRDDVGVYVQHAPNQFVYILRPLAHCVFSSVQRALSCERARRGTNRG